MTQLSYGIIGAGLIGRKRADAIRATGGKIVAVWDVREEAARKLAQDFSTEVAADLPAFLALDQMDAVVVATPNGAIPDLTIQSLAAGKHVLIEKPGGRNPADLDRILKASEESGRKVGVGFNHRFHPALQSAKRLILEGAVGPLMYFRARYGHGGRIGYDREWRADPAIAGGGELLDQGVHLIDLTRWLGGEFQLRHGIARTFFWDMPVEDNGFLLLEQPETGVLASLHASCTEWKNLFEFEIFGKVGKLYITGLGRSYGVETLRVYRMKPEMGPPLEEKWEYREADRSWELEMEAFEHTVQGKENDLGTLKDAHAAVSMVHETYKQSSL